MAKIIALTCPSCSARVSRDTKKCGYCGTELIISEDGGSLIFSSLTACPKCGTKNPEGRWFCEKCEAVIEVDDRLKELQKRERFLQKQNRDILPKNLLEKIEPEEYIHYVFYNPNVFYYAVTHKRIMSWTRHVSFWTGKEKDIDYWEAKYGDIVTISDPVDHRNIDGSILNYTIEIGTYSRENKVLKFGGGDYSSALTFQDRATDAYRNYLDRKKEIRTQICFANLEKKDTVRECSKCGANLSTFSYDIKLCPYCGKTLATS